MMEKEQVFNIEFDNKVTANKFASNGILDKANNVSEVKQGKRMMMGPYANTLEFMPKPSL